MKRKSARPPTLLLIRLSEIEWRQMRCERAIGLQLHYMRLHKKSRRHEMRARDAAACNKQPTWVKRTLGAIEKVHRKHSDDCARPGNGHNVWKRCGLGEMYKCTNGLFSPGKVAATRFSWKHFYESETESELDLIQRFVVFSWLFLIRSVMFQRCSKVNKDIWEICNLTLVFNWLKQY